MYSHSQVAAFHLAHGSVLIGARSLAAFTRAMSFEVSKLVNKDLIMGNNSKYAVGNQISGSELLLCLQKGSLKGNMASAHRVFK